jgi:hypothetical protein
MVACENGATGTFGVPSGASPNRHPEAVELGMAISRTGDKASGKRPCM